MDDFLSGVEYGLCACALQLCPVAVAPGDADSGDAVFRCAVDVVLPVTDHDGGFGIHAVLLKCPGNDLALGISGIVGTADDLGNEFVQTEVVHDRLRTQLGLGGGDHQPLSGLFQISKELPDAGIDFILQNSAHLIVIHPELPHGLHSRRLVHAIVFLEGLVQGWTDEGEQALSGRDIIAHLPQGILDSLGNAKAGIGQRTVQVE